MTKSALRPPHYRVSYAHCPVRKGDLMEYSDIYANDVIIGYWYCERVLQSRYGQFVANEYGQELLKGKTYAGGSTYSVAGILENRLNGKE